MFANEVSHDKEIIITLTTIKDNRSSRRYYIPIHKEQC